MKLTFEELVKKQIQLNNELNEVNEAFTEVAKEKFQTWSKDLFERYPNLEFIYWTQYTPYFNDGDPCRFRSNHDCYGINTKRLEEFDQEGFTAKEAEQLEEEVGAFFSNFDSSDMKRLFGDHCAVYLTKEGVAVEDYDHD